MLSAISKCEVFRTKHTTFFEGDAFLKNEHKIVFSKLNAHFLVEKKTPLVVVAFTKKKKKKKEERKRQRQRQRRRQR